MTKQELELGKFYQYPFPTIVYPLVETEQGQWRQIMAYTPFVLLAVTIPKGFSGQFLKVLTKDGEIVNIEFSENFLEKLIDKT